MTFTSFSTLFTIARFEAKTLVRGWLFKIFVGFSIFIIAILDLATFSNFGAGMQEYRIAGGAPYMNILILNIIQAVIAIFLSSDFIGRDKKLDTTEAFYVRSMSNFNYVIGKTLGIITVFFFFNLFILLIGFAYDVSCSNTILFPVTYVIYPLLISLPTIMLILGMSFFLMTLIKNQAVTFILMLGFIGVGLFYLTGKLYNVFDFIGVNTPMAYSVFTGLNSVPNLLLVRGAYVLLGLGFIFFTVLMLPRLPQEKQFKMRAFTGMGLTFIPAIVMIFAFIIKNENDVKLRANILKLEETLPSTPSFKITDNSISLVHKGKSIFVTSNLTVIAENNDNITLILNQGFDIKSVKIDGKEATFNRNLHTILLKSDSFPINEPFEIEVVYSGSPNDKTTFPEIPEDSRKARYQLSNLTGGKQISYISSDYLLLTAESDWYPVAASRNYRFYRQFTNFNLKAEFSANFTAFSQGKKISDEKGKVHFETNKPYRALSLTAGKYETRSITVDSVEIMFAMYPKHLKIYEHNFSEIIDTIPQLISEMKRDYERKLGLPYPFERFSLIEVPIHFFTYPRNWTLATEDNMPEQLLMVERGGTDILYDIKLQRHIDKSDTKNSEEKLVNKEQQTSTFKNIIGNMLFSNSKTDFGQNTTLRSLDSWNKHSVFPQYTSNISGIEQEGFPALWFIIENYLFTHVQQKSAGGAGSLASSAEIFMSIYGSNPEQLILKLKDNNFISLIDSMKNDSRLADLVSRKGNELFEIIRLNIEPQDIDEVLNDIIINKKAQSMSVDEFKHFFDSITNKNISSLIENWLQNNSYSAFLFGDMRISSIKDGSLDRYFVRMQLVNNGTGSGIITVAVREQPGQGGTSGIRGGSHAGGAVTWVDWSGYSPGQAVSTQAIEKTFEIPVNLPMEIGIICNFEPREIVLNTHVAQNLPSTRKILIDNIIEEKAISFEGIRPFNGKILSMQPYEFVVDNEDEGFSVIYKQEKNTVKDRWMSRIVKETEEKYKSINHWQPSHKWQFILGDNYYGSYIKSAVYIRKGAGDNKAQWKTDLPESGNYSVYVFLPKKGVQDTNPFARNETTSGSYTFTVTSDDGAEEIKVDLLNNDGWYFLGDFYISKGATSISLSDKTEKRIVVADAVKWVRK